MKIIKTLLKAILGFLGVLFILSIIAAGASADKEKSSSASTSINRIEKDLRPEATVKATMLSDVYESNPINADAQFRHKIVAITGMITDIDREVMQHPYVILNEDIQCVFSKDQEAAVTNLRKGQTVTIAGEVKGRSIINVLVDDCYLDFIKPTEPEPVMASAQLAGFRDKTTEETVEVRKATPVVRKATSVKN